MRNYNLIFIPSGRVHKVCDICNGSGEETCPRCVGYGTFENGSTCDHCHGKKTITCNICHGYGYVDD